MLHDPVIDEARAQGVSIAEYLRMKHDERRQRINAIAAKETARMAAIAEAEAIKAAANRKAEWRKSWRNMVALAKLASRHKQKYGLGAGVMKKHKLEQIKAQVAAKYGLYVSDMEGNRKTARYAVARFEYFWRALRETKFSMLEVGQRIGKDHTTVYYGAKRYEEIQKHKAGNIKLSNLTGYAPFLGLVIPLEDS